MWSVANDDVDDDDYDYYYRCDEMVKHFSVSYVPGGATQNTIRIAQVDNRQ